MEKIKLKDLRKAVKEIEPEASVSGGKWDDDYQEQSFTVKTRFKLDKVRVLLTGLGLKELQTEIEGSRRDWVHVLTVVKSLG